MVYSCLFLKYPNFGHLNLVFLFHLRSPLSKSTALRSTHTYKSRPTSHYGRRSRGRRFPPIKLQETKSSASRPFTLRPKSKGRRNLKCLLFDDKATDSRRKFGSDGNGNPNYGREAVGFFSLKKHIDKILAVRLEGLFWARNKVGCSFGFGLWAWPLEASHYARPRLQFLYFIDYFQPISLDSQQSLATQSHGLSTWTAIV